MGGESMACSVRMEVEAVRQDREYWQMSLWLEGDTRDYFVNAVGYELASCG
jgi:hypothetical protein